MKTLRFLLLALMTTLITALPSCTGTSDTPHPYRGTNLAGGDISWTPTNTYPPVSGTDFQFVTTQDIDYLVSKKIGFGRLLVSWESLQPTLNQPLAVNSYHTNMSQTVAYATSKGMNIMIEIHGAGDTNFAKYKGNFIGSAAVPNSAFADFWSRMALEFKSNPRVIFGLTNEPHFMSTVQWFSAAQAGITAIRSAGFTNIIMVPGNGWTSAENWTKTFVDTATPQVANSTAWLTLNDPLNNLVASVHMYLDANDAGIANDIVSPTIGVERLASVVAWGRANKVRVHLSEIGASLTLDDGSPNPTSATAVKNVLDYVQANNDVIIGFSWWAYGPPAWWGGYRYTLCPTNNYTVDNGKMAWIAPYLIQPLPAPPPVDSGVVDSGTLDAGVVDSGTVDAGAVDSGTVDSGVTSPPLTMSSKVTYNWGTGYCKEFYFTNATKAPVTWSSFQINMRGGTVRDQNNTGVPWDTWGGAFSARTGVVTVTPASWNKTLAVGTKATIGFCADFSKVQPTWTGTFVLTSLKP